MPESKIVFNSKLDRFELHHTVTVQPYDALNTPTWAVGFTWTVNEFNRYLETIKGAVESQGYDGRCYFTARIYIG